MSDKVGSQSAEVPTTSESQATVRRMAEFEIRDVSAWEAVNPEPIGRDAKLWVREPGAPSQSLERDWLFKPVIVTASGHRQGEDWTEKIVSELGGLLGVPCAEIELAVGRGVPGSISRNVAPDGWNLVLGSVLLSTGISNYQEGQLRPPGRPGHSPRTIFQALGRCEPPAGSGHLTAVEVFAGYLVLDAWVANQDRHDQNWAVLRQAAAPGDLRLASSYDHASSLGFNLLDARRETLLGSSAMADWATRGTAHRFEHDPGRSWREIPTLVATAHDALDLAGQKASRHWIERLRSLEWAEVEHVIARIPNLSDVTASFILELLTINRRRLLHEH